MPAGMWILCDGPITALRIDVFAVPNRDETFSVPRVAHPRRDVASKVDPQNSVNGDRCKKQIASQTDFCRELRHVIVQRTARWEFRPVLILTVEAPPVWPPGEYRSLWGI